MITVDVKDEVTEVTAVDVNCCTIVMVVNDWPLNTCEIVNGVLSMHARIIMVTNLGFPKTLENLSCCYLKYVSKSPSGLGLAYDTIGAYTVQIR